MKKIVFLFIFVVNVLSFSIIKDGIYSVEKKYDDKWTSVVKMTVKDSKIIGINYDRKDSTGATLTINSTENEKYKNQFGETFRDASFKLSRGMVSTQDTEKLESIKDSKTFEEFKEMIKYLLNKAENGMTGAHKIGG